MKVSDKFDWYLVFSYDVNFRKRGEIFSRHKTYESAAKALKKNGYHYFLSIKEIEEVKS